MSSNPISDRFISVNILLLMFHSMPINSHFVFFFKLLLKTKVIYIFLSSPKFLGMYLEKLLRMQFI